MKPFPSRNVAACRRLLLAVAVFLMASPAVLAERPNIVLVFIDDMGWKDVGCYGSDIVETPRIDRLATEGVRFTDFYAAGAVCSPSTAHRSIHVRLFED